MSTTADLSWVSCIYETTDRSEANIMLNGVWKLISITTAAVHDDTGKLKMVTVYHLGK